MFLKWSLFDLHRTTKHCWNIYHPQKLSLCPSSPPISHLACVTLDYFHPLPPCQAYMIRPWWLLLSFSPCNVVFHAFLPNLLDQQYSLCPSALPPSSPCPFPPSVGLTYTAWSGELAFLRGGFCGNFRSWCAYWLSFASRLWSLS